MAHSSCIPISSTALLTERIDRRCSGLLPLRKKHQLRNDGRETAAQRASDWSADRTLEADGSACADASHANQAGARDIPSGKIEGAGSARAHCSPIAIAHIGDRRDGVSIRDGVDTFAFLRRREVPAVSRRAPLVVPGIYER